MPVTARQGASASVALGRDAFSSSVSTRPVPAKQADHAFIANHARSLTENGYFNGHPDLIVAGFYRNDRVQAGSEGIEIKSTRKKGGAVDTHGARDQWMCVFVYEVDTETEPARDRRPMSFTEVYLAHVGIDDFRSNARGELGTRTATLHRDGVRKLREHWIYKA